MVVEVQVRRDTLERAVEFLRQFHVQLQYSRYPHDEYRKDAIEDVIAQIERRTKNVR